MTARDLAGRRIVVTGATDGIGRVTAERLAQRGAEVAIVARNADKVAATVRAIAAAAPDAPPPHGIVADLAVQAEVRRAAVALSDAMPEIDVLVNNAGAMFDRRVETADGIERTVALNHLAYALLTARLLPALRRGRTPRIVNVASRAHVGARLVVDDLQHTRRAFSGWRAYAESKLHNILHTVALARRLDASGVTVNALHPGFVASRFGTGAGVLGHLLRAVMQVAAIDVEAGARTSIFLAGDPSVAGRTGGYYVRSALVAPSAVARDVAAQEALWQVTERLIGESAAPG